MPIRRGNFGSGRLRAASNKPFRLELLLQLLEGKLQCARALRLERLHNELIFAPRFIHFEISAREHRQSVLRLELRTKRAFPLNRRT